MSRFNKHDEKKIDIHFCFFGRSTQTNTKNRYSYQPLITTMAAFSNAQITQIGAQRFQFEAGLCGYSDEEGFVVPDDGSFKEADPHASAFVAETHAAVRDFRGNADDCPGLTPGQRRQRAALDAIVAREAEPERPYPGCPLTTAEAEQWAAELDASSVDRFSEDYNRWHTLDDHLDYGALLRGIHNIQERGGSARDEERFLNAVTDRWGHPRLTTQR